IAETARTRHLFDRRLVCPVRQNQPVTVYISTFPTSNLFGNGSPAQPLDLLGRCTDIIESGRSGGPTGINTRCYRRLTQNDGLFIAVPFKKVLIGNLARLDQRYKPTAPCHRPAQEIHIETTVGPATQLDGKTPGNMV